MRDDVFRFGFYWDSRLTDALFLCVERWVQRDGRRGAVLSPDLRTEDEVDQAVDGLIADIEIVRRDAKAAIRRRAARQRAA